MGKDFIITARMKKVIGNTNYTFCHKCKKDIEINSNVHTRRLLKKSGNHEIVIYHRECWEGMFI